MLEQNINATSASCLPGYPHGRLALVIFCFHINSILWTEKDHIQLLDTFFILNYIIIIIVNERLILMASNQEGNLTKPEAKPPLIT